MQQLPHSPTFGAEGNFGADILGALSLRSGLTIGAIFGLQQVLGLQQLSFGVQELSFGLQQLKQPGAFGASGNLGADNFGAESFGALSFGGLKDGALSLGLQHVLGLQQLKHPGLTEVLSNFLFGLMALSSLSTPLGSTGVGFPTTMS